LFLTNKAKTIRCNEQCNASLVHTIRSQLTHHNNSDNNKNNNNNNNKQREAIKATTTTSTTITNSNHQLIQMGVQSEIVALLDKHYPVYNDVKTTNMTSIMSGAL
jgi:hypothetical protein